MVFDHQLCILVLRVNFISLFWCCAWSPVHSILNQVVLVLCVNFSSFIVVLGLITSSFILNQVVLVRWVIFFSLILVLCLITSAYYLNRVVSVLCELLFINCVCAWSPVHFWPNQVVLVLCELQFINSGAVLDHQFIKPVYFGFCVTLLFLLSLECFRLQWNI